MATIPSFPRTIVPQTRRRSLSYVALGAAATIAATLFNHPRAESAPVAPKLRIEQVGSDSNSFNVVASIITGPTEAILWDAQYHLADARRLADRIAASGKKLKAVIISHPDHDHFAGAAAIVERFPGTPVYMTAKGLEQYKQTAARDFRGEKTRSPQLFPDSIVTPTALPSMQLTVDGEKVEVIPDLTGDVISGVNSVLWIPSISTVLASDVIFNNVHAWFGSSDTTSRKAWRKSIERIAALKPRVVIAGHKRDVSLPDTPDVLQAMDGYIVAYDSLRRALPNAPALYQAMSTKYSTYSVSTLLRYAAQAAYNGPPPGVFDDASVRPALTAINKAWSQVRLTYDSAAAERLLTPDFYVQINGNRMTRQEFIRSVSQRRPNAKLVRFDNPILSITKDANKEEYVAAVMEKLETEVMRTDGGVDKIYSLWITRDGFRRVGSTWQIMFSEAVSSQNWGGGQKPPFADW
jgi:glyoxylase-like metal-dependent hydrolase (beta-lactamase superfamily II)